jgi:hypothetical protein
MTDRDFALGGASRRQFIAGLAAAGLASSLPGAARAAAKIRRRPM